MTLPVVPPSVVVPLVDYAGNHAKAIADGLMPATTPAPTVKRYTDVPLLCTWPKCPSPNFTATFDEVQRILLCPTCGNEVHVPAAYRGMP